MPAQDEGRGPGHEGHLDQAASAPGGGTGLMPAVIGHEELLAILDDIRDRVARGDSYEGSIEWMIPEDPAAPPRSFGVRASYRTGNLQGQGGMRMTGTMATAQGTPGTASDRCTDWCRQQGSQGHYATTDGEKARMSWSIGDGLFEDGMIPRSFFPGVADALYREGHGYNAIADWAGRSHEEGYLAVTGQLGHWVTPA